jgi:hypothetical protein
MASFHFLVPIYLSEPVLNLRAAKKQADLELLTMLSRMELMLLNQASKDSTPVADPYTLHPNPYPSITYS